MTPVELPPYARIAATLGRPMVLLAALVMSAPGEYQLAIMAGWSTNVAWLMPVSLSVYAAVAAVIAATRPKGTQGRTSAIVGAGMALALAMTAQTVAHLIGAGYMTSGPVLIAAVSSVPPIVTAHMMHLAATPKMDTQAKAEKKAADGRLKAVQDTEAVKDVKRPVKRSRGRRKPSIKVLKATAQALEAKGHKVTGPALAKALGVSDRTGARYLSALKAA